MQPSLTMPARRARQTGERRGCRSNYIGGSIIVPRSMRLSSTDRHNRAMLCPARYDARRKQDAVCLSVDIARLLHLFPSALIVGDALKFMSRTQFHRLEQPLWTQSTRLHRPRSRELALEDSCLATRSSDLGMSLHFLPKVRNCFEMRAGTAGTGRTGRAEFLGLEKLLETTHMFCLLIYGEAQRALFKVTEEQLLLFPMCV